MTVETSEGCFRRCLFETCVGKASPEWPTSKQTGQDLSLHFQGIARFEKKDSRS